MLRAQEPSPSPGKARGAAASSPARSGYVVPDANDADAPPPLRCLSRDDEYQRGSVAAQSARPDRLRGAGPAFKHLPSCVRQFPA